MKVPTDISEETFTSAELCGAAGCKEVTFRAWRRRNPPDNLFPRTFGVAHGGRDQNLWSVWDILVVRLIVVLTGHGIPASDAIWAAQGAGVRAELLVVAEGLKSRRLLGISMAPKPGDPEELVYDEKNKRTVRAGDTEPTRFFMSHLGDLQGGPEPILELIDQSFGPVTIVDLGIVVRHVLQALNLKPVVRDESNSDHEEQS